MAVLLGDAVDHHAHLLSDRLFECDLVDEISGVFFDGRPQEFRQIFGAPKRGASAEEFPRCLDPAAVGKIDADDAVFDAVERSRALVFVYDYPSCR